MKTGKISESILKRSVLKYCKTKREEVVKGAAPGVDCAFSRILTGREGMPADRCLTVRTKYSVQPHRQ